MNQKKIAYLDGWRGVAICLVLIGHFFHYWRFRFDTFGVDVFFVLSGLLMTKLLFADKIAINLFYKRRISRIFPAFYFYVFSIIAVFLLFDLNIAWPDAVGSLLLIRNYYPEGFGNALAMDHIWSLSVEEHSYIGLSLIAILSRKYIVNPKLIIGFFICFFVIMSIIYTVNYPGKNLYETKLIHSEVSAFGIFSSSLVYIYLHDKENYNIHALVFPLLLLIAVSVYYYKIPSGPIQLIGVFALALLVNLLHKAPSWMIQWLSSRILRQFGICSFSIYLWQQPFFLLKNIGIISAPIGLLAAILMGVVSYYFLENPVRLFLNKKWASY